MGRARVTSGGTDGYYTVELITDTGGVEARLSEIAARLAEITAVIDQAATSVEKSRLRLEQISLTKQQSALAAALTADQRDVWCADFTEDLAAGTEVGTIEINGDADQILITPAGDTATALGKLQHPVASTPAGVAVNMALMPCWQRWKPTYRIGEILAIDTETDTCDVGIEAQYSRYQGLPINQAGETWEADKAAAVSGWAAFCAAHPDWDLVTETGSTQIAYTPALAAELEEVNAWVNSHHHYTLDEQQYGKLEHWTIMAEGGAGDCEDYALTKAQMLLARGYPASALHIEVGRTTSGEGHAWLVVQTDAGDIALDLNYSRPMRTWELPYGERMRQTGESWAMSGVRLSTVPIEYMDGTDSVVFDVGDRVVISFTDQDWSRPVVIGFEDHPRADTYAMVVEGDYYFEIQNGLAYRTFAYHRRSKDASWSLMGESGFPTPYKVFAITDRYYVITSGDERLTILNRDLEVVDVVINDYSRFRRSTTISYTKDDVHIYDLDKYEILESGPVQIDGKPIGITAALLGYQRNRLMCFGATVNEPYPLTMWRINRVTEVDSEGVIIREIALPESLVRPDGTRLFHCPIERAYYLYGLYFTDYNYAYGSYAQYIRCEKYDYDWRFMGVFTIGYWYNVLSGEHGEPFKLLGFPFGGDGPRFDLMPTAVHVSEDKIYCTRYDRRVPEYPDPIELRPVQIDAIDITRPVSSTMPEMSWFDKIIDVPADESFWSQHWNSMNVKIHSRRAEGN